MNLTNIDVDQLFEQHSIAEINIIEKKIQTEVERKREELRTMVGERYRDLLKAADTIAKMKDISGLLIDQVENITASCKSLNEQRLIGFKTETDTHLNRYKNKQLNNYFSTVVQIKLLTNLPEMIWCSIDNENFFLATQLFIFARHISTGLQLDMENSLMQYFPVAKKQWEIIKPFFFTIKQCVLGVLENEILTPETATNCLLSLFLLETTSLDNILNNFIQLRTTAFLNSLMSDTNCNKRVKDKILNSLKVLNSTANLIYECFFGTEEHPDKGLIYQQLEELSSDVAPPTVYLMDINDSVVLNTLPDIIAKFKPSFKLPTLDTNNVRSTTEYWLKTIADISSNQLKSLVELISSMKIIQEIKKESQALPENQKWNDICKALYLPSSINFYEHKYKALINERIRDIVRQSWKKCVTSTYEAIEETIKTQVTLKKSNELSWLWSENPNDIPLSLKQALSLDKKTNKLLMKTKGFSNDIIVICTNFNAQLEEIVSEVNVVLSEQKSSSEDKISMAEFLRETSEEQAHELITQIKNLDHQNLKENYVFLARLSIALIDLCPSFQICLTHSYTDGNNWEQLSNEKKNLENWTKICNLFDDESFQLWKKFCEIILQQMDIEEVMSKQIGHDLILHDFVNWETVTVEENDEPENPVQSQIRIPSQPRISLQMYLFQISEILNASIPQTLPLKVLLYFDSQLVSVLVNHYANLVEDKFVTTNQNIALQLYFDLKFLQIVFVSRDDRLALEQFQKITNQLKTLIDPFDFELFHSYLNANIKKSVHRTHSQLGVLLPFPENVALLIDAKPINSLKQDQDPNVLSLSSTGSSSTWFPLLPIIMPGGNKQQSNLITITASIDPYKSSTTVTPSSSKSRKSPKMSNQNYASNVKSGAAAILGAAQDWFR